MKITKLMLLIIFLFLPGLVLAAEIGSALKTDNIRKEPYSDSPIVGSIERGEKLQILAKQGAWLKIKTDKASGWVRLLAVKRGTVSSSQTVGLQDLTSGRAGTGQVVATTGVRGLDEEQLKSAKYNAAEMKKLESYTQTAKQGEQFAKSGALKPVKVAYLPEPQE